MNLSVRFSNARHDEAGGREGDRLRHHAAGPAVLWIPPLRQPQPGPDLPPDFNGAASPENSAQLGIEEFYNDPMLIVL